jgi:hypothetical protein
VLAVGVKKQQTFSFYLEFAKANVHTLGYVYLHRKENENINVSKCNSMIPKSGTWLRVA